MALDLLRNWEFRLGGLLIKALREEKTARSMVRRRSSLVVEDLPEQLREMRERKEGEGRRSRSPEEKKKKKKPTQFVEPEASSLLDSFGF